MIFYGNKSKLSRLDDHSVEQPRNQHLSIASEIVSHSDCSPKWPAKVVRRGVKLPVCPIQPRPCAIIAPKKYHPKLNGQKRTSRSACPIKSSWSTQTAVPHPSKYQQCHLPSWLPWNRRAIKPRNNLSILPTKTLNQVCPTELWWPTGTVIILCHCTHLCHRRCTIHSLYRQHMLSKE